jgi:short-subunit dehydrogenase
MSLRGQVVVITGASSGIGSALARELASRGCKLGLIARRADRLAALADELRKTRAEVAWEEADVADRDRVKAAFAALAAKLGPADRVVANAGLGYKTPADDLNVPETEAILRVNFFGVVYAFEAALPAMLSRGRGHLVAVSSVAGFKGLPGTAAYCASKAAVNAYVEGLRIQFRGRGVACTTVCPGFVRTEMTAGNRHPMPWVMDADRAARIIADGIERKRKWVIFPRRMSVLMWLARWAPDWWVAKQVPKDFIDGLPGGGA